MWQIEAIQCISGITDFALTAHKDQDIPRPFAAKFVHRIENRLQLIAVGIVGVVHHRAVTDFHRISPAGNFNNRRVVEVT
ncbi:hypothetical protein D3C79_610770 [compost metagenome]